MPRPTGQPWTTRWQMTTADVQVDKAMECQRFCERLLAELKVAKSHGRRVNYNTRAIVPDSPSMTDWLYQMELRLEQLVGR